MEKIIKKAIEGGYVFHKSEIGVSIIYNHESKVVAITKEIEKTISPDKVTEMYNAVREEVEANYVRHFSIKTNEMNGVVVEFMKSHSDKKVYYLTRFVLNGKDHIFKDSAPEEAMALNDSRHFVVSLLENHYKNTVLKQLMKSSIDEYLKSTTL